MLRSDLGGGNPTCLPTCRRFTRACKRSTATRRLSIGGLTALLVVAALAGRAAATQADLTALPPIDTLTTPAIAGGSDSLLYAVATAFNGLVAVSTTTGPSVWTAWDILGPNPCTPEPCIDPSFRAHATTAPILLIEGTTLHVFARGADDELYHIAKRSGSAWPAAWDQLTDDAPVEGRISVAWTSKAVGQAEFHVLFTTHDAAVEYRRFERDTVGGALQPTGPYHRWCDADEGVIAADGEHQVGVVLRKGQLVGAELLNRPWLRDWQSLGGRLAQGAEGQVIDLAGAVFFASSLHALVTEKYLCDDIGPLYCHVLSHSRFRPGQPDDGYFRIVYSYTPSGGSHALGQLAVYRNKLVALYRDEQGHLRSSRLDSADPLEPWVGGDVLDASRTTPARPGVGTLDRRPVLGGAGLAADNFGNDLFAIVVDGTEGDARFINASRSAMGIEIDAQIEAYDAHTTGCVDQTDSNAPTLIANIDADGRPFFTELGMDLWMLPDWLSSHAFHDAAEIGCLAGNSSGRFDPPCATASYPVIIKDSGGIFICSGIWLTQNDDYLRIWEEFGHTICSPLGFSDDNSMPPTSTNQTYSGIPLATLLAGFSLFGEDVRADMMCNNGSDPGGRCRGFTGVCCPMNYDVGTRQHSFMYVIYHYVRDGDHLRDLVASDLAAGDDLLQRKYEWIRDHIFHGLEFHNDSRPLVVWNDACLSASTVTDGIYTGETTTADGDGSTSYGGTNGSPDVWLAHTSSCNGLVTIDTEGSDFDTVLSVHSACPGSAGNEIVLNDDCLVPDLGFQSCVTFTAVSGTTYYVRLGGYNDAEGHYRVNVASCEGLPPLNDDPAFPLDLTGSAAGSLAAATPSGTLACSFAPDQPDTWYRYTAPINGTLHVNTCGTNDTGGIDMGMDTIVSVHDPGCAGTLLSALTCNDDWPSGSDPLACTADDQANPRDSAVTVPVMQGQTVVVRVSKYPSSSAGDYVVNASVVPTTTTTLPATTTTLPATTTTLPTTTTTLPATTTTLLTTTTTLPPACMPGDCNTSDGLDAGDPVCTVLCLIGQPGPGADCACAADCNCVSGLEASDPVCAVLRLIGAFVPDTCGP